METSPTIETPPIAIANLTNDELAALYAHRVALEQRAQARPPVDPPPVAQRRSRPDVAPQRPSWGSQAMTALLVVAILGMFGIILATWLGWTPPQLLAPTGEPPYASGAAPAAAPAGAAPMTARQHAAPAAAAVVVRYELTPPPGWRAAWSPEQEPTIDLGSWTYRIVQDGSPWQEIELSDGRRLWLRSPAPMQSAPVADHPGGSAVPAPAIAPLVDAQDMALPSANGTGGSTWGTAPISPSTPIPAMLTDRPTAPLTFDPAHAGPGGSSGGSTWGQP